MIRAKRGLALLVAVLAALNSQTAQPQLPDPTRPANFYVPTTVAELPAARSLRIVVQAIRIRGDDRSAIINGQLVRAGDHVDNIEVVEIQALQVVLDHESKRLIVPLYSTRVEKRFRGQQQGIETQ